jgi:hypothetical protein
LAIAMTAIKEATNQKEGSLFIELGGLILAAGMLLGVAMLAQVMFHEARARNDGVVVTDSASVRRLPEIQAILSESNKPTQQATDYLKLIKRIGPVNAQEALQRSGLPFNGNSHLINHTVGEYLYRTYGNKGLTLCKDYFLSSCYHGFLLNITGDQQSGEDGSTAFTNDITEIIRYCDEKGAPVLTQCAHAIGHGLLAYEGYAKVTGALQLCDQLHAHVSKLQAVDCYDGVFMENIYGAHEGAPSPDRWIKEDDLLYPCNDPRIDRHFLEGCWRNQVSIIWPALKGDPRLVGEECQKAGDEQYVLICFHAVAQFIQSSDKNDPQKIIQDCRRLDIHWQTYCLYTAATASFAFGDHHLLFALCPAIEDIKTRTVCFAVPNNMVTYIYQSKREQLTECRTFPWAFIAPCLQKIFNTPRHAGSSV